MMEACGVLSGAGLSICWRLFSWAEDSEVKLPRAFAGRTWAFLWSQETKKPSLPPILRM